jgi:hypothetical protein
MLWSFVDGFIFQWNLTTFYLCIVYLAISSDYLTLSDRMIIE